MSEFEKYPMLMTHPNFRPAQSIMIEGTERRNAAGQVVSAAYKGTPEMLPPVTVKSVQEEDYYASQGYEPAGKGDPAAWVKAHASAPPDTYTPQKYPLMRMIDGRERIINSAAEDPDADPDDLMAKDESAPALTTAPPVPNEVENLRLQLQAMQEQMARVLADLAEARAAASSDEDEALEAVKAGLPPHEPRRGRGRPRKPPERAAA